MAAMITVNNRELPCPVGLEHIYSDAVNNGRNALGEIIGERVGRTQTKLNNLEWVMIDTQTAHDIITAFDNFFVLVKFYSIKDLDWVTLKMYPGDRSAQIYYYAENGVPTKIRSLKVNIIDCGIV